MFGIFKSLFGRPRKATTVRVWLSYGDRGREGLEAIVELQGANVEGFPWTWARNSVRSPGADVSAGTIELQEGWVDRFTSHGFAPGSRNGEPVVVAKEGLGSWASVSMFGQHPGTILLGLPDEVFDRIAKLGAMVQEATLVEPNASFVIRMEQATPASREDEGDDATAYVSSDPEPFTLTEEESAAVGRLVGLGYVLGTQQDARAEDRETERQRDESAAVEVPPPSGMWATLPAIGAGRESPVETASAEEHHLAPVVDEAPSTPSEPSGSDWTPSDGAYGR